MFFSLFCRLTAPKKKNLGKFYSFATEGCRNGLCKKRSGAALCQTQLVQVSSTMNPPQDRAEAISQTGVTSVKTCLRKGKMLHRP